MLMNNNKTKLETVEEILARIRQRSPEDPNDPEVIENKIKREGILKMLRERQNIPEPKPETEDEMVWRLLSTPPENNERRFINTVKVECGNGTSPDDLLCPHCGDQYIHQINVEIFSCTEDAPNGDHWNIPITDMSYSSGKPFKHDDRLVGNPSARRSGLKIQFACECCGRDSYLNIAQHKGTTEISWTKR